MKAQGAERTCRLLRDRSAVDSARRFAELAVSYCDPASREATVMVVTELAENVVKYAAKGEGPFAGSISIAVQSGMVRIRAVNEVASARDAERAKESIVQISGAPDVKALYRSRLAELFANPGLARAQLGLLRAAFEGGFRLSCSHEPPTFSILAERPCELQ